MSRAPARLLGDETRREDDWPDLPDATRAPRVSVLTRGLALGLLVPAVGLAIVVEWGERRHASGPPPPSVLSDEKSLIASLAFSADGRTIAAARLDGSLSLWDVRSRRRLGEIALSTRLRSVAFSPDGRTIATTDRGPAVLMWETSSGKVLPPLEAPGQRLTSVAFSPDGHMLAAGGCEGRVTFWDLATPRRTPDVREGHKGATTALAFSPDDRTLASGGRDGAVRLWDAGRGQVRKTVGQHASNRWSLDGQVVSLAFSRDGMLLASAASFDPFVRVWDTVDGGQAMALEGQISPDSFVSFLPDGRSLLSADDQSAVRRWDLAGGRSDVAIGRLNRAYLRFAASPDGRTLAIAEGATLMLRDLP